MMNFDMLLIAAAALSTAVILFAIVINCDRDADHQHARAGLTPRQK